MQEGCPGESRNYILSEVVSWARENKWGDSDGALMDSDIDQGTKDELARQKVEKLKRENRLLDNKIDQQSESLVDVAELQGYILAFAVRVRSGIEAVEKKFGPDSCSPVRNAVERIINDVNGGAFDISDSA